jgi:hypothetical protein
MICYTIYMQNPKDVELIKKMIELKNPIEAIKLLYPKKNNASAKSYLEYKLRSDDFKACISDLLDAQGISIL